MKPPHKPQSLLIRGFNVRVAMPKIIYILSIISIEEKRKKKRRLKKKSDLKSSMTIKRCEHGKEKRRCKDCKGSGICEHNMQKAFCKDCKGSVIFEHNKQKYKWKECAGSSICEHNLQRHQCASLVEERRSVCATSTSMVAGNVEGRPSAITKRKSTNARTVVL